MSLLPCIEIEPNSQANASIIWLHGLGASGHDFAAIVPALGLPDSHAIRFIFPHAPSIPVTVNNQIIMPAWYDILAMGNGREINEQQLEASAEAINKLIAREEEKGVSSERILLAGFSQGGAVAYHVALSHPKRLAGLLALSTYFATSQTIKPDPANQALPIQIHHGNFDSVVPESLGLQAYRDVVAMGFNANYQSYPMDHEVCPRQINDI